MNELVIEESTSIIKVNDLFYNAFSNYINLFNNLDKNKIALNDFMKIKKQVNNTFNQILAKLPPNRIIDVEKEQSNRFIVNALIIGSLIELINLDDNIESEEIVSILLAKIKSILVY
jgi:hypothetical protein